MNLRPYQRRVIDQLYNWWMIHPGVTETPLMVLPTGAGKSIVIAELTRLLFDTWPELHPRTVILVPSKELAEQNAQKLIELLPSRISIGYYASSLGQKRPDADVIVATIGSIYKDAHLLGNIKCVIVDECFTGNTLVETTSGSKPISSIRQGDCVYTATGLGIVEAISERKTSEIFIVRLSNGTEIRVTGNHPFFTASGWKCAKDLAWGDGVISLQDMPELWRAFSSLDEKGLEWKDVGSISKTLRESAILLNLLLEEKRECNVGSWSKGENARNTEEDSPQAVADWWKRSWNDGTAKSNTFDFLEWMDSRACHKNRSTTEQRNISDYLQGGYWERINEDCHRTGRSISCWGTPEIGCEKGRNAQITWVESVSSEELPSPESVYNLQVGGHPSYFAEKTLVHNCHLINPDNKEAGRFRKFLTDLAKYCQFRVVGTTATPFRGDGVWLTDGDDPLFTGVAATVTVQELLDNEYLAPLVRPVDMMHIKIDTNGIKTTSGDYNLHDLAERVKHYLPAVADEAIKLAADRKKWIGFTATVENACYLTDLLNQRGIISAVVTGKTPKNEREKLIADFRAGRLRCLITVLALATGFDVPDVDCIIWCRPTISPVLYVQGAGRGLRIAPGKTDCLWLDFSDTTERLGPVDAIRGRKKNRNKTDEKKPPQRICEQCGERCSLACTVCPICGFEFPQPEKIERAATASNAAVMAHQVQQKIITYPVTRVDYNVHQKDGSPDSLKVNYYNGIRKVASEWVCLSHSGFARAKAETWWQKRSSHEYLPRSTDQAMEWINNDYPLEAPAAITVNETGKYPEIIGYQWQPKMETA